MKSKTRTVLLLVLLGVIVLCGLCGLCYKYKDTITEGIGFQLRKLGYLEDGTVVYTDDTGEFADGELGEVDARMATAGACLPENGKWGKPGGTRGSLLNSKCGQAPDYEILDKTLHTCTSTGVRKSSSVGACLAECCARVGNNRNKYDPSWFKMAQSGCALCCNYFDEPHFNKFGTCFRYVEGEPAIARTSDVRGPMTDRDWRGFINAFQGMKK